MAWKTFDLCGNRFRSKWNRHNVTKFPKTVGTGCAACIACTGIALACRRTAAYFRSLTTPHAAAELAADRGVSRAAVVTSCRMAHISKLDGTADWIAKRTCIARVVRTHLARLYFGGRRRWWRDRWRVRGQRRRLTTSRLAAFAYTRRSRGLGYATLIRAHLQPYMP